MFKIKYVEGIKRGLMEKNVITEGQKAIEFKRVQIKLICTDIKHVT